jgi:hypothetical protein
MGDQDLEDLQISVSLPDNQITQRKLVKTLDDGDTVSKTFNIVLPKYPKARYDYLKITASNDNIKRTIYREIKLPV